MNFSLLTLIKINVCTKWRALYIINSSKTYRYSCVVDFGRFYAAVGKITLDLVIPIIYLSLIPDLIPWFSSKQIDIYDILYYKCEKER